MSSGVANGTNKLNYTNNEIHFIKPVKYYY